MLPGRWNQGWEMCPGWHTVQAQPEEHERNTSSYTTAWQDCPILQADVSINSTSGWHSLLACRLTSLGLRNVLSLPCSHAKYHEARNKSLC